MLSQIYLIVMHISNPIIFWLIFSTKALHFKLESSLSSIFIFPSLFSETRIIFSSFTLWGRPLLKLNAHSFQFINQITLFNFNFWSSSVNFLLQSDQTFTLLDQKLKLKTSILMFGKRNLDYKLKTIRIQL